MFSCRKVFADIPFAHRQHRHPGHCSFLHGHNWAIALTFGCKELDSSGFVVDFGRLGFIKQWIETHLDHACLFNAEDPLREQLIKTAPNAFKAYVVKNSSCEGLAQHFYEVFNPMVIEETQGRVFILQVEVIEDTKNSASFCPA